MRRVNYNYFNRKYRLEYDNETETLGTTPKEFRYDYVTRGEFRGNQIIQGWLMTDSMSVIKSDSKSILNRALERGAPLRGDKILDSTEKEAQLITRINPPLEQGIYDPIFGLPLPGDPEDVRSVGFIDVVAGATYKFYLIGLESTGFSYIDKGTFGSVGSTTGGDLPQFNDNNVTDKGTFGSTNSTTGGDLPSAGNTFGDLYTCDKDNYTSVEAGEVFDKNDTATYDGVGWVKNAIIASINDGYTCDTDDYVSNVAGRTFQSGDVVILNEAYTWELNFGKDWVTVLQFDDNEETTTIYKNITYNQPLTLEPDTVKVKFYASNILLDGNDITEDYRIAQEENVYPDISEVVDFIIEEDTKLMFNGMKISNIRGRRTNKIVVMKLS